MSRPVVQVSWSFLSAFFIANSEVGSGTTSFDSFLSSLFPASGLFRFREATTLMAETKAPKDIYLSLNSDLATSITPLGSTFTVNFSPPLELPPDSKNVTVAMIQGTFWWTIPNFQTCTLELYLFEQKGELKIIVPIPKGIYNYKQINILISNELRQLDYAANLIQFVENGSTSTIDLEFKVPGAVLFPLDSCEKQFGYDANVRYQYLGAADPNYSSKVVRAERTASFDTIQYLTIATTLVDNGFRMNGGVFKGIISNVTINAAPGYQITAEPALPLEIPTNVFQTPGGLTRAEFNLMDQDGNPVDTNGEAWTLLLRIRYYH